ncbi:hypothetical protein SD70_18820 [Gordoniibacillus kamchatkensis]|uniref:Uncharacterized protein n=1 Tax=Gordoniibacillus kamchatkensis TaxID=1590651 RepID=A0ABR5AEZ1_9BACL|nr:hypothetical protein SD70_18820 [Paenibacillus sp. VKM B-2647]
MDIVFANPNSYELGFIIPKIRPLLKGIMELFDDGREVERLNVFKVPCCKMVEDYVELFTCQMESEGGNGMLCNKGNS